MAMERQIREERFFLQAGGHCLRALALVPSPAQGAGTGTTPTLVFLHEALGSIRQWRDFPHRLAAATGCRALVYDRCGAGGSDPLAGPRPLDYLEVEARKVLPEVLAACGIDRPVLVGHSDGGTIALLYAAAFPDGPVGIVTEAAHVFVEEITLFGIRAAGESFANTDFRDRLKRYHGERTDSLFAAWRDTWLDPAFRDWNVEAALASVRCPVLALQGAEDEYGSPRQLAAIADGVAGPVRQCLLPDCGHTPHRQAPEAVLEETARFIASLPERRSDAGERKERANG
jgi:pimeloyl-ACP methyl ester carboxylesterase